MIISHELSTKFMKVLGEEVTKRLKTVAYDKGDYLDFGVTDPTKISYIPANRFPSFDGAYFCKVRRAEKGCFIKLSKLLTLVGLPNTEVSKLTSKWSGVEQISKLQCVEMSVTELYRLADQTNGLGSCMTGYATEVGEFYENFNVVGMAFYWEDEFVARALLWREVTMDDGSTTPFLDRIYSKSSEGNNTIIEEAIVNQALSNGWLVKNNQSCRDATFTTASGEYYEGELYAKSISGRLGALDFYPYIDTLQHVSCTFDKLSTQTLSYEACETEGGLYGLNVEICEHCGERILEEDVYRNINGACYCSEDCLERAGYTKIEVWAYADDFFYDENSNTYYRPN